MDDVNRGLYNKYTVKRNSDPLHKHDNCEYFVLDLTHDPYAVGALATYIEECKYNYPTLAEDLQGVLDSLGSEGELNDRSNL